MKSPANVVPVVILAIAASGCVTDPPVVSPRFAALEPAEIAVAPVENRTLLDLTNVSTKGALQTLLLGSGGVNVPAEMRDAILESLGKKGYRAAAIEIGEGQDFRTPLPPGEKRSFDAVLIAGLDRWDRQSRSEGGEVEFSGTLEVIRVGDAASGGGEVLYRSTIFGRCGISSGGGVATSADLAGQVRRSAFSAIRDLPPRKAALAPVAPAQANPPAPAPPSPPSN
jgi:hypothetical protein